MLNSFVVAGRLVSDPQINEAEEGKETICTLSIPRPFKNEEGVYENDLVPIIIKGAIADSFRSYCHPGDLIGAKGRIDVSGDSISLVAEKVTFLSSKKEE